jgi:hypothetical protein
MLERSYFTLGVIMTITADVLYAGLFGVLATLAGTVAAHALTFSRDLRVQRDEFKALFSAMATELRTVEQGFRAAITHIPRFASAEVFTMKGGNINAPIKISVPLMQIVLDLQRIKDLTNEHSAFCIAVASAGQPNVEWSNRSSVDERQVLVSRVLENIPGLVAKLDSYTQRGRL